MILKYAALSKDFNPSIEEMESFNESVQEAEYLKQMGGSNALLLEKVRDLFKELVSRIR
jgi:hypothetical protein